MIETSGHLPECSYDPEELKWLSECNEPHTGHCICDRVERAYERGLKATHEDPNALASHAWTQGYADGRNDGRLADLDALHTAVQKLQQSYQDSLNDETSKPLHEWDEQSVLVLGIVLDMIKGLRGEQ